MVLSEDLRQIKPPSSMEPRAGSAGSKSHFKKEPLR